MDIYFNRVKEINYYLTMAQIEANALWNVASQVSSFHIGDGLTRIRFLDEIKSFIATQLKCIRLATSGDFCFECIANLKTERENLRIQDRMLRTGEAYVAAAVKIYEENGKIVGYVISGIGVIAGVLQVVGGISMAIGSAGTGNIIGIVAGATLIFHGLSNSLQNIDKLTGVKDPENIAQNAYMGTAEFLGFERKTGMIAYQGMNLITSAYGIFRPMVKPEAWRLYDWLPADFYRKISTMSRTALSIEIGKSTYQLYNIGRTYRTDEKEFTR